MLIGYEVEGAPMKNPASRFFALLRQLFKDDRREVRRSNHNGCVWRIPPASKERLDGVPGDDDIDFIRIIPSRRPR